MQCSLAACAAAVLCPPTCFSAQRSREEEQVRGWYRDYLGREVGPELRAWVELLKAACRRSMCRRRSWARTSSSSKGPRSANVHSRNAAVRHLVRATLTEVRRWTDRLNQLRGDRFAVAREILLQESEPVSGRPAAGNAAEWPIG